MELTPNATLHERLAVPRLLEALDDSPSVLVHGPRQCGKSTLARNVGEPLGYAYRTFDDPTEVAAVREDPVGWVERLPERVILDEVQRVPELFTTLKAAIDRRRVPGRFLLTGSTNVLLLPKLADSLAGRMSIVRLHPLSQCELERAVPWLIEALFSGAFPRRRGSRDGASLPERIVAGGYPAALARADARRRSGWYLDFAETIASRDVREIARIGALDAITRLLGVAAGMTAQLLNLSDLAAPFELSRPTIADYVTLLERVFLIDRVPAWHTSSLRRAVKTAKLHVGDTGLACALRGIEPGALEQDRKLLGPLLETFVLQELRRQAGAGQRPVAFHHYRDKDGVEVDLVLEGGVHAVAGVEVKAARSVAAADFRGLRRLREIAGARFTAGAVLYDGEQLLPFGDRLWAVPISSIWANG